MSAARWRIAIAVLACFGLGGSCGGGSGSKGRAVVKTTRSDPRCTPLGSVFPPGFDFVPGNANRLLVLDFSPPTIAPYDVEREPFEAADDVPALEIPADSDGDGRPERFGPILDDIVALRPDLALVTASSYEEVIFYDPRSGTLRELTIAVPETFAKADNPLLPDPGTEAGRTALSTSACVRPPPDALDSRGDPFADSLFPAQMCDPETPSFRSNFTSGAAVSGGHLFVSTSNVNLDQGMPDTQFLPGAVLVYDVDLEADPPRISPDTETPVILTQGFNATHVTAFRTGDRDLALVTVSGAVGIAADDPDTSVRERGGIPLTEASVEVIDAETLRIVATIPLGFAAVATSAPAIDPTGRVAFFGAQTDRVVYAVDLAPLADLPTDPPVPLVLDGSTGPDAVIFDAVSPFRVAALPDGAPETCVPFTGGVAFNHAGDRVYVTEFCDGSLATIGLSLAFDPPVPVPAERFLLVDVEPAVSPIRPDTNGDDRALGVVAVRPGRPGVDFAGPDVFFLYGDPGGMCGLRVEAPGDVGAAP